MPIRYLKEQNTWAQGAYWLLCYNLSSG